MAPYTTAQFPADNHFGAEVRVTLGDGTVLTQKVDQPFGRTARNPLPPTQLKEKFMHCARRALSETRVMALYDAIQRLEQHHNVREVIALTASPEPHSARPARAVAAQA